MPPSIYGGQGPFPERPLPPTPPATQPSLASQQHPQGKTPNHHDVALPWSGPRRRDIVVVAGEGQCGLLRRKLLVGLKAEAGRAYPGRNIPNGPGCPPQLTSARTEGGALPGATGYQCRKVAIDSQDVTDGYVSHEVILVWAC